MKPIHSNGAKIGDMVLWDTDDDYVICLVIEANYSFTDKYGILNRKGHRALNLFTSNKVDPDDFVGSFLNWSGAGRYTRYRLN